MSDSGSMNLDLGVNLGVTLDGAGLQELSNTIKEISKGKDLQRYWKDVESATDSAAKAIERYNKNVNSKGLAENLLKQINALKALTKKENLSELFPNMELNLDELVESAKKIVPQISSQFSVDSFSQAFKTFDLLKEKSIDLSEAFRMLSKYAELVDDNLGLRKENSQFRELIGDSDVEEVKSKLLEIKRLRDQAEEIFTSFLKVNNVERTDYWGDEKFSDYFDAIRKGSLTATEAISRFKTEYAYLLEDGFKSNNDTFGLEQLQAFSNKLDSIFRQVEETSTKINDIISNGVITKSVENLSMDSSLSDSQRSLFGNLLQDEESLKSITALFQKLIEESNKTSKVDLFNDEQLQQVLSIFDKMEKHLSSLRSIISDVGDGEEFSPLLKMINNVQSSISELATSVKGIGLNMNIDVGSDGELDRKLQSKIANALQAYQKLFNNIKMSSAGGSFINQEFFDFNLDNYDTAYQKLQAIVNFIKKQRVEAKKQFNGYDALYEDSDKSLWKSAQAYLAQVTKAETEIKKANSGESNPLENLFGNTKDLSEVIEQLNKVVEKLNEISSSATEFKNIFKEGFNVTASVEEIDKLTNKVKELEDELAKIKLNPVNVDKSNISSGTQIEDVFQGDDKVNTDASTTAIKEESQALEEVSTSAKDAAISKEKFANANKEVKASAESSSTSLNEEKIKIKEVGESADEVKSKLDDVIFKPNTDGFDEIVVKLNLAKDKIDEISKITKSSVWSESQGKYLESYNIKYKNGNSEIRGESSNKNGSNVLRANETAYDAKAEAQESKRLVEENIRLNKAYYDSKKQDEAEYQRLHAKYLAEGKAQEEKYYADLQKYADSEVEHYKNREEEYQRLREKYKSDGKAQEEKYYADLEKTRKSTLESYQRELNSFDNKIPKKPADGQRSDKFEGLVQNYKNAIKEAKEYLNTLGDSPITEKVEKDWENLISKIKKAKKEMDDVPNADRGSDALSRGKEIDTITKYLNKFTGISKQAKQELKGLLDQLQSGDPSANVKKIHEKFLELTASERVAGREARNLFDIFKEKKIYSFLGQAAGMFSFYDLVNLGREVSDTVIKLNTDITELAKVSEQTSSQIYKDFNSYADIAQNVRGTISDTISATADWSRNGYGIPDAKKLAEVALLYKNVGDGINIDDANESLISTLKGFQLSADQAEHIVDVFNEVDLLASYYSNVIALCILMHIDSNYIG